MAGSETVVLRMHTDCKQDDYSRKGLWEKLQDSYYERHTDPSVSHMANMAAVVYFWFIISTELYVMVLYVIPHNFSHYSDTGRLHLQILCWFFALETVINWTCLRRYQSFLPTSQTGEYYNFNHQRVASPEQNGRNDMTSGLRIKHGSLSWSYCVKCQAQTPPRCHHCALCDRCVLKRDHHCYMSGVCVGFHNQRYFIVLNFYISLASFVGLYFIYVYAKEVFFPKSSWSDLVLPVTIWNWGWGSGPRHEEVFIMFHLYTLWWTGLTALGFFTWQFILIILGKTDHEVKKGQRVRFTGRMVDSFRSVFGSYWPVNFLFPAGWVFKQEGNGQQWDNLKVY